MDYIERLQSEIKKGFTKTYLEQQIGLPKNSLASYLSRKKKMTLANEARVIKFLTENPELDIFSMPRRTRVVKNPYLQLPDAVYYSVDDGKLTKIETPKQAIESKNKPITAPKKEKQVNTPQKSKESKFEPQGAIKKEPKEGSTAFFLKYGVFTYAELEQLKNKQ